jgi:hypothetical protein
VVAKKVGVGVKVAAKEVSAKKVNADPIGFDIF